MKLKMRNWLNAVLWGIFIFCIVFVFLYKLLLTKIDEWFFLGYEFGQITYDLSLATLASFIFYVLVTILPKREDTKNLNGYFEEKRKKIVIAHFQLIRHLFERTKAIIPDSTFDLDNLKYDDFKLMCSLINMAEDSLITTVNTDPNTVKGRPLVATTWAVYLEKNLAYINKHVSETLALAHFLNSHQVQILSFLQNSTYSEIINNKVVGVFDSSMGVLQSAMYEYYHFILKLNDEWQ